MARFRSLLPALAAALVGAAMFGAPTRADAAFSVRYSVNGGAFTQVDDLTTGVGDLDTATGAIRFSINSLVVRATASGNSSQSLLDLNLNGLVLANTGLVIEASVTGLNTINAPV
ncbi:MAG: hypothetical protein K2V38_29105, partial [Gemmataceae bacterium]|nr:hypothetical protein [Gemmataceae bacterium]